MLFKVMRSKGIKLLIMLKKQKWWQGKHGMIAIINIEIFWLFMQFIQNVQHNQQYDTLLPVTPCMHKLKAGIAY
jgi:hypothetical protein